MEILGPSTKKNLDSLWIDKIEVKNPISKVSNHLNLDSTSVLGFLYLIIFERVI